MKRYAARKKEVIKKDIIPISENLFNKYANLRFNHRKDNCSDKVKIHLSNISNYKNGSKVNVSSIKMKSNNNVYTLLYSKKELRRLSKWAFDKIGNLKCFKDQINDYKNNILPNGTNLIVSDNSASLKYANILDNPIVINQSNIKKILTDKHSNVNSEIVENLDLELNNSVFTMDSLTQSNSRVVVLNQVDNNGNPIIATIKLNKTNASVLVNEVTSVYDKKNFQNFINRTIENNKKIYINEKTEQWLLRSRLQLPTRFADSSVLNENNTTIKS